MHGAKQLYNAHSGIVFIKIWEKYKKHENPKFFIQIQTSFFHD